MKNILKYRQRIILLLFLPFLCLLSLGLLLYTGLLWPNALFASSYQVRGLDVSSYQQKIDWKLVSQTGTYTFVFMKATEGKYYKDPFFQANWQGARTYGILRGAYHYYTEYRTGAEQADNYISVVPKEADMLPPVLDLEVSGPDHAIMLQEIKVFLDRIEAYYGVKPIIYTDHTRYDEYIKGNFTNYAIWIHDILIPAQWSQRNGWTFWQYSNRGHIPGVPGFVDLNVFFGDKAKLQELTSKK
ncbi:GH25 family lysozyme [Ktedonobacter racemifer]|uniref:Glycoside hydrolase family 25 n=1 Tax=Ktedonobacter racemifer DSM 44963 TaxID=485913 RepID=D6U6E3_KTERA|nr:GH25 family lysozyme [Ktedonobacter racemifer]EFH80554.1 glycoside hydrolase family 25 [Ktedonobacter racemifer DSM 44963]